MDQDKLNIEYNGKSIDLDVSFGYLDRCYSEFNFTTDKNEEVEGFCINLNTENLDGKAMKELDEVSSKLDKFFNTTLNLDGIIHKGKAKIAKKFDISGFNVDVEIHSA